MFEKVYRYGPRNSGRTWRQVSRLPDGAFYLVLNKPSASHVRYLLTAMGRSPHALRIETLGCSNPFAAVRGIGGAYDIDHAVEDQYGASLVRQVAVWREALKRRCRRVETPFDGDFER